MIRSNLFQEITGHVYEYAPPYYVTNLPFIGLFKTGKKPAGVWIVGDGYRIFRPNSFYDHIKPLEPKEGDIF